MQQRFFTPSIAQLASINVFVNGKEVTIPQGATVYNACEEAGEYIPHFCYHDRLSIAGNCRMCLVEVEKSPKPVASCANPAMPGMKIFTNTDQVKKAREGVMEFMLANHPLDCPICDQGGECDLQDQSEEFGQDHSRYRFPKRGVEDKDFGPLVKTTMTRCIHCTRCVRFSQEVAGFMAMGTSGRGNNMEIGTYVNEKYDSELSGNVVDLCPVGALTSKPYAFTARPWELHSTESIDCLDAVGANIRLDVRNTQVMRILPRVNEDVNEEWLADKSRFAYDGLNLQRLDEPLIRDGDGFSRISWREALEILRAEVAKVDGNSMKAIAGDLACAESMIALKDLMNSLGCEHLATTGPTLPLDARASYLSNSTIVGFEEADVVLLVGSNPRMEAPLVASRFRKSVGLRRQSVAMIGPECDLALPYQYLGNDSSILSEIASGTHAFAATLQAAERPAVVVGMAAAGVPGVLDTVNSLKDTVPNLVAQDWNGLNVLHTASGRVAALDMGFGPGAVEPPAEGPKLVYLLNADNEADILREVPSLADAKTKPFTIYQGHTGDVGASMADLILPGVAYTEKNATYVNLEGRVQRTAQAGTASAGQAREDWTIVRAISEVLGQPLGYTDLNGVRSRLVDVSPSFANVGHAEPATFSLPTSTSTLASGPFEPYFTNYYMTDPISRVSKTMAKCSAELPTARNSYL
jgi:NADH dehydrogenase (ubiquinone) Fe-S protein 1